MLQVTVLSMLLIASKVFCQPNDSRITIEGLFIIATHAKLPADPRLSAYEAELQRNLPESSFRLIAQGSSLISSKRAGVIVFDPQQRVELRREHLAKPGMHLNVQWMQGREPLVGGVFTVKPGIPIVLMHRPPSDETGLPIVVLVAKRVL